MDHKTYPSDLTDKQWKLIEPHIPPERWGGRTRSVDMRQIFNAILYLNRTGCQWRAIPHDFPNWHTVRHYYDRFRRDGTWRKIHDLLREKLGTATYFLAFMVGLSTDNRLKAAQAHWDQFFAPLCEKP